MCAEGDRNAERAAAVDGGPQSDPRHMLPFRQSMVSRPLQMLHIRTEERVTFDAAAMAQLTCYQQLQSLDISNGPHDVPAAWMDGQTLRSSLLSLADASLRCTLWRCTL